MRPMECSDEDIRQAGEIVMRIDLLTTAHVQNIDRITAGEGTVFEVELRSDDERIEFETRVKCIHSLTDENSTTCESVTAP